MRPLMVLTGVVFGSCLSITVSLAAVLLIYLILGDEYPRVAHELSAVMVTLLIFTTLTAIAGLSFYTIAKNRKERWWAQAAMWTGLVLTGWYFWP